MVSLQFSCTTLTNLDISIQRDSKYKCKMWGLLVDNEMDTDEFDWTFKERKSTTVNAGKLFQRFITRSAKKSDLTELLQNGLKSYIVRGLCITIESNVWQLIV